MTHAIPPAQCGPSFPKLALKLKETADALSVSPITIRRWVNAGHLHPVRAGRHLLFTVDDIRTFLANAK